MPDPNATPAPLTMTPEKERAYRAICSSGGTEVDPVFSELDATRAKLAQAESRVSALTEVLKPEREPYEETCAECGAYMVIGDGLDPTPECNGCAQNILRAARAALSTSQDAKGGTVTAR